MGSSWARIGWMILSMTVVAGADKVLVLYSPWSKIPELAPFAPSVFGLPNTTDNRIPMTSAGPNWWTADLGATAPTQGFSILNEGSYAKGGVWHEYTSGGYDTNLAAVGNRFVLDFSAHDTIWMVPDSLQGGAPRLFYSKPSQITVMFWNPWEVGTPGSAPRMKVDQSVLGSMTAVPGQQGWYSTQAIGFTHLDIFAQSPGATKSLGTAGIVNTATTTPVRLDSLVVRNDTAWILQSGSTGPLIGLSAAPVGTVLDFYNPWDGQYPMILPVAQFGDGFQSAGLPLMDRCGWFRLTRYDLRPTTVYFKGSGTTTWGTAGAGSVSPFQIAPILGLGDTVRIAPDSLGVWQVGPGWTTASGQCFLSRLAGTIRDFDSTHPAFEHFYACGVTTNMVKKTLGSDGTPVWDTAAGSQCGSATIYQWFHDNPAMEYTTCADIPLALNQTTSTYTYENGQYFPIDSIPKSIDRFNDQTVADDGKPHNFHFCMETHAVFDYRPGQKFDFVGDDDVWVYINKKLVVNLGGVHDAAPGSVLLDSLGLVSGRTYPFDFFFCERRTVSSHMKITTSLNLRNIPDYEIKSTHPAAGVGVYDLWSHNRRGQGCQAIRYDKVEEGKFTLIGPGITTPLVLPVGVSHGGFLVRADSGEIRIDSAAMAGLIPGIYTVRIQFVADSTKFQLVYVIVPVTGQPSFVEHTQIVTGIGVVTETDVWSLLNGATVPTAQPFKVRPVVGVSWCADSLCQRVLGPADTLMTGPNGVHRKLWIRSDSIGAYNLVILSLVGDSVDSRSAIFRGNPPDSAIWTDVDGDGRADHVTIWLHHRWSASTSLMVAWPDNLVWQGPAFTNMTISADSMVVQIDIPGGLPGTMASTTDLGRWSRDGNPWVPFAIQDRVPPVPTRAVIHRGTAFDTLRVPPSEPIRTFGNNDDVLRKRELDGTLTRYVISKQWLDTLTGELVLVFPAGGSLVPMPGDSVRFPPNGKTMDVLGNVPAQRAKSVQILGTDRPPYDAVMFDSNGDGKADQVVLRFQQPLTVQEYWMFKWPNDSGDSLDIRISPTEAARSDSGGRVLTFSVPPYEFGSTSCPAGNCANLGSIVASNGADSAVTNFTIRDGVPPVAVLGVLRYASQDGLPDTLTVKFSEPVVTGNDPSAWVAYGDTVPGNPGHRLGHYQVILDSSRTVGTFYVDTFVVPVEGNGIRINSGANGGLLDSAWNAPGDTAAWGKLVLGPIPPRLNIAPYNPYLSWDGTLPPEGESPIQLLVHGGRDRSSGWQELDGTPVSEPDRLVGGIVTLNGSTELAIYLYDNTGVHVATKRLANISETMKAAGIAPDARGNFQIWAAWDGKSTSGKVVGSGIYLMRVVGWRYVGTRQYAQQHILHLGWGIKRKE